MAFSDANFKAYVEQRYAQIAADMLDLYDLCRAVASRRASINTITLDADQVAMESIITTYIAYVEGTGRKTTLTKVAALGGPAPNNI
jgi:hypothetical protein